MRASCASCNSRGGAKTKAANQRNLIAGLEETIWEQEQRIEQLLERLSRYENGAQAAPAPTRRNPANF